MNIFRIPLRLFLLTCLFLALPLLAMEQQGIEISSAWARATLASQKSTAAYLNIRSANEARLVGVESPLGDAELHTTKIIDGIMRMREIPFLDLPADKQIELRPGGHHIMLMQLKTQLVPGLNAPLILIIESEGRQQRVHVKAEVLLHSAAHPSTHMQKKN